MEAVPDMSLYKVALIVLGAAGVVIPIFHRLHVSSVLGFILVGVAVGPFGFGAFTHIIPGLRR
jgi:CPA2 family monovalent cation:H+ antiporter-2